MKLSPQGHVSDQEKLPEEEPDKRREIAYEGFSGGRGAGVGDTWFIFKPWSLAPDTRPVRIAVRPFM
jgi:hypothetical protein